MKNTLYQSGFSAAELLITLFIASLFLISGYQLYTYVVRDGQESSQLSKASNLAYQYLRSTAGNTTYVKSPCSTSSQPGSQSLAANTGLNNASVNVVISCPYSTAPLKNTSLLTATVTYGSPNGQETVSHAMLAGQSTGSTGDGGGSGSTTIASGDPIQTVTSTNCPTTRTMVVDARDNHTYWVQKLADGKCWMLTNLAYAGGGTNTYNDTVSIAMGGGTSYTAAYYYIPDGANPTSNPTQPSTSTTGTGQYGYLYNFCAANGAQTGNEACSSTSSTKVTTTISICPKNWRLPTSSGGEFTALNNSVNSSSTNTDAGLRTGWLAQRGGYWSGGAYDQGSYGYYWSSSSQTPSNSTFAYHINFSSTSVNPSNGGYYKYFGFAVRCVAS